MLEGLRTVVYHVADLQAAKDWYNTVFGIKPYFDEPFYVGYDVGGFELGLNPDPADFTPGNNSITYWGVKDIRSVFIKLKQAGVAVHGDIRDVGGGILVGSIADEFGNIIGLIENPHFKG